MSHHPLLIPEYPTRTKQYSLPHNEAVTCWFRCSKVTFPRQCLFWSNGAMAVDIYSLLIQHTPAGRVTAKFNSLIPTPETQSQPQQPRSLTLTYERTRP